jgi:rod shape-determining protein MreC
MRERGIVTWVVLAAVLLALLNLPGPASRRTKAVLRDAVAPVQGLATRSWRKLVEAVRTVRGFGGLVRDHQAMSAELLHLRNRVQELRALEWENQELRRQLDYGRIADRRLVPCEVIARDMTGWWHTLRVNKGTEHGIGPDMAVVTSDGLIGRTIEVATRSADVLLISDPICRVSARVAPAGAFGIVEGTGPSPAGQAICRMQFVNRNLPVQPGNPVVTAGLGGVFPGGLLIGYVEKVEVDEGGLYQRATVVAQADVGAATYVFIVLPPGAPSPAPGGKDAP